MQRPNATVTLLIVNVSRQKRLDLTLLSSSKFSGMEKFNYGNLFSRIADTAVEYLNVKADEYKIKTVDNLSLLTNKILVALIATMLGTVILLLLGVALAFILGAMTGSIAWGFIIVAILFAEALLMVYISRKTLFMDKVKRMYLKMFFGNNRKTPEKR